MYLASQLDAGLRAPARPAPRLFRPHRSVVLTAATLALSGALVAAGHRWPLQPGVSSGSFADAMLPASVPASSIFVLLQLGAAALIGMLVTSVQREVQHDRTMSRSMEQAQTLLCVAGALMMIIIGNSLARAFGIAGAAAIIRFRTPVDDPRDTTVLFLLLALGMAAGIGALTVAGIGTLALCALLPALDRFSGATPKMATLECTAAGRDFPAERIRAVLAGYGLSAEPREVVHGDAPRMKYIVALSATTPLEQVTQALVDGAGLAAVSWDIRKKS